MESRGLPLLSGPPPPLSDQSRSEACCRKCGRDFNVIFARSKKCNHCGYSYCHSCTDYQALMPRSDGEPGHVVMPVCSYCIDFLQVTAAGKGMLRVMALSRLRKYVEAYNIKIDRAVEKDDLINAILAARGPNGCLPPANEEYYRRNSVPNQGRGHANRSRVFTRSDASPPPPPPPRPPPNRPAYHFPRPDLAQDNNTPPPPPPPPPRPNQHHQTPPRRTSPPPVPPRPYNNNNTHRASTRSPPPPPPPRPDRTPFSSFFDHRPPSPPLQPRWHSPPPPGPTTVPTTPQHARSSSQTPTSTSPHTRTTSSSTPSPAHSATPTLDDLLSMTPQTIATLPISVLKSILFTNHVNAGMVLEKAELVSKVHNLVDQERRNRDRQVLVEQMEELERQEREREYEQQQHMAQEQHTTNSADDHDGEPTAAADPAAQAPKPKPPTTFSLDREGLCVVCYDNDANIAIIDCGHLAMCRDCSDLIMASSKECPLCRTRIVTESRLLRIFKT